MKLDEQRRIVAHLDGLDLTPVPSPNGEGCLLAKVIAFPLASLGDDVRDVQSTGGAPKGCNKEFRIGLDLSLCREAKVSLADQCNLI